jgi:DNA invertase Pin-like site-specific DNA recombinase
LGIWGLAGGTPSETSIRATGTIRFLALDSGVAGARGLALREEFVDTGVSGARSSGPACNKLLEAARLRQFDLVLVLRLDRWGRSVADCVDTLRLLTSYGVAWLATSQGLSAEASSLMGRP